MDVETIDALAEALNKFTGVCVCESCAKGSEVCDACHCLGDCRVIVGTEWSTGLWFILMHYRVSVIVTANIMLIDTDYSSTLTTHWRVVHRKALPWPCDSDSEHYAYRPMLLLRHDQRLIPPRIEADTHIEQTPCPSPHKRGPSSTETRHQCKHVDEHQIINH